MKSSYNLGCSDLRNHFKNKCRFQQYTLNSYVLLQITDPDCYKLVYKKQNYPTTEKISTRRIQDITKTTIADYLLM